MNKRLINWLSWSSILILAVFIVMFLSLCIGSVKVSLSQIFNPSDRIIKEILFKIRLPRIILGFAVGGALAIAGVILQGLFRNPLVEPYTLGISGGAGVFVCLNIVLKIYQKFGVITFPISGFVGAGLVIILVYILSIKKGKLRIQGLLLTGVMISFISSSLIMLIMAMTKAENLHGIVFWIMGSLEEPNIFLVKMTLLVSILGLLISCIFSLDLNAFSCGEKEAHHLGVDVEKTKKLLFILASVLTGVCVSVAGIIGFVGLLVPHLMRMLVGEDHRILLLSSYLCGAGFLIFSDTLARTIISPLELPVGVITGIIGGSLFIYVLTKRGR
ncbi:MAG: iron ABC transporter permease [Candidatus Omnitrophota bacterium]|nr:MAG: iron ABC transporter permease [Candidatus Omnitrophota bacterium]RKY44711.1 MAG: iron ABC transporter permease [Candidatus Omnitrophota bacterium]